MNVLVSRIRRFPLRRLLSRRALVLVAATAAVIVATASIATTSIATASNPFVAGERSVRGLPLAADASARAIARATVLGRSLGLPPGIARAERYDDRFEHATYDEVTTSDAAGHPLSLVRLDLEGRLRLGVAVGLHEPRATVTEGQAANAAARLARSAGIDLAGSPDVARSQAAGGWLVSWPRLAAGAPVRGDGTRVALWADGSLHSIGTSEHPLTPAPAAIVSEAAARAAAGRFVAGRFGVDAGSLAAAGASLVWIAPNDTWDPSLPDAPDAVERLAWVVEYRATGALADRLTAIEVWLDAGSLAVLGGDVAR
ncbi:MAG TPA: hypothetical protein VFR93_01870 [Candidatus Limnocylindrales bacterium]|nr:hypothetical protein [Candidatus Limnocylindrales bacterium]